MTTSKAWDRFLAREWIDNQEEVTAFARDMVTAIFLHTAEDVIEFLEKPWHWQAEHDWWLANDRPDTWEAWEQGIDDKFEVK